MSKESHSGEKKTNSDNQDILQAETWLNMVTTLKSRFIQISPDGTVLEGNLYLKRPGYMRIEYDPPTQLMIICNPNWFIHIDKELHHSSYLPIDSTPAGILTRPQIHFNDNILKVTKISEDAGLIRITVIRKEDPKQGQITLIFTISPFALKQWEVIDSSGQITTVSLMDVHDNVKFDNTLFEWHD